MSTVSKLALHFVGGLKADRVKGRASAPSIVLPPPETQGGMPLMEAIAKRRSMREFSPRELPQQELSNLLWAAFGVSRREEGGRTAPTARDAQEIDIYVAMPGGLYIYAPHAHALSRVAAVDARKVTGFQDFVDKAPIDLVYVADYAHVSRMAGDSAHEFSAVAAGAICENVYLYCASAGLATVVRGWFDRESLGKALELTDQERVVIAQTVGYPLD
ncbi:MAG TPA: nitroreductase family protein [Usitatibacter sp.]|nr:nitroreductase family protein [Usitatibacter sp.]